MKMHGEESEEAIEQRIHEAAEIMDIGDLLDNYPRNSPTDNSNTSPWVEQSSATPRRSSWTSSSGGSTTPWGGGSPR